MKEHNSISFSRNLASKYINKKIKNVLNDISCPERVACYLGKDGGLICYLNGGDKFIYDPSDRSIEKQDKYILDFDFNELLIDIDSLDKIINKLQKVNKKQDVHDNIRQKYGITKKTIKKKDLEEISKYEQSINESRNI